MAQNAYQKSQSLGLTGTDAEIVTQLRPVTERPIDLADLMELLNFRRMLQRTDGTAGEDRWKGKLQNLKAALVSSGSTDFVAAYELWFSHVTNPRQFAWDTTHPQWSAAFLAMQFHFADMAGMPSVADFEAVAALGGGRPYLHTTAVEFDAQRVAAAEQAIADAAAATAAEQDSHISLIRSVRRIAIKSLDAESIIGNGMPPTLDETMVAIRASLTAFGAWA